MNTEELKADLRRFYVTLPPDTRRDAAIAGLDAGYLLSSLGDFVNYSPNAHRRQAARKLIERVSASQDDLLITSRHRFDNAVALETRGGDTVLAGVTYATPPAGTRIIGNGTLQHPLSVELRPLNIPAVAELVTEADKADKMLHNLIQAYVPEQHRAAWLADKADLRAALDKFKGEE